jgi:hypothetical protein
MMVNEEKDERESGILIVKETRSLHQYLSSIFPACRLPSKSIYKILLSAARFLCGYTYKSLPLGCLSFLTPNITKAFGQVFISCLLDLLTLCKSLIHLDLFPG